MNIAKNIFPKEIRAIFTLAIVLNVLCIILFRTYFFAYIFWNIFLAVVPFVLSSVLLEYADRQRMSKILFWVGGFIWLLLVPNAPYIITDLIHIGSARAVPTLYEAFLLFSSAYLGLILGMHSLFHIEQIIKARYSKKATSFVISLILLFMSFGMYIGRFLRFNSWDVVVSPSSFIRVLYQSHSTQVYLYSGLFFLFLYISYLGWKYGHAKEHGMI